MSRRRLSQRQKERIEKIQERRRARLSNEVELELSARDEEARAGIVVCRHGANVAVADTDNQTIHCVCRQNLGHLVCGDRVVWQKTGEKTGVVTAVLERRNLLSRPRFGGRARPLVSNLSQLIVVIAPYPEPSWYLLDQYLVAAESVGVKTRILVNKLDLLNSEAQEIWSSRYDVYRRIGYPLSFVSALHGTGIESLTHALRDETNVLVGQSGVGKSSLVMALLPDLEIQTGRLSAATGLGRHTTSETSCYDLPLGGRLIDSPGVRDFGLTQASRIKVEQGFRELVPFLGRCRFANCRHRREPGCALLEAVNQGKIDPRRFENFQRMLEESNE